MTLQFQLTYDYLCPFARNANEFVLTALAAGAPFDVQFTPFSQAAAASGQDSNQFFEDPQHDGASGILALLAGLTVRDQFPEQFPAAHRALFAARHDDGLNIKDKSVVAGALKHAGVDVDAVFAHIDTGAPKKTLSHEHHTNVHTHQVWGVPTFITDERAVFVRLMDRPNGDTSAAIERITQIVNLVNNAVPIHEFKQVDLPQ